METPSDPEDPGRPHEPEPVDNDGTDGKGTSENLNDEPDPGLGSGLSEGNDENEDGGDDTQSESLNWLDWLAEKWKETKVKISQLLHMGLSEESSPDS